MSMQRNSIKPGKIWLDNVGKPIQAHGGAMFYENGVYYWYGENKENTDGVSEVWTTGIKCYSSRDLYNWKDEGYLVEPSTDKNSLFYPAKRMDRPHILYNAHTKKYVMWVKFCGEEACFAVLTNDTLVGKYTAVREYVRPYGKKGGDFDLIEENGKAYLIFDADHEAILLCPLSDDYLDAVDTPTVLLDGRIPPETREAPAHMFRNGIHYLFTSGMTGYLPNPSEVAASPELTKQFIVQGDSHGHISSFNSQISYIFKLPGKDVYIAMADRWVPDFDVDEKAYNAIFRCVRSHFDKNIVPSDEDKQLVMRSPMLKSAVTQKATYVWLPIRFDGDRAHIDWVDEWRTEDL